MSKKNTKKNYFVKAMQNEDFRDWLKQEFVDSAVEKEKNGESSYYDNFQYELQTFDESPYSFITQEEWDAAIENDYDDDNQLLDAHEDEIVDSYADLLMDAESESADRYDGLTIKEAAKALSGTLFTAYPLMCITNPGDVKNDYDNFVSYVEQNIRTALHA